MTQDPKKLPNWLRRKKADEPPKADAQPAPSSTPPPASSEPTPSSGADADVAPWLRDDLPPPPSKVKRVAPPTPEGQQGDVPPWLAGMDEPKSYKIGGTELSEEYLAGGDALPETLNSDETFDAWMANQVESKRVKDIEEEVPEDLISAIQSDESAAPPGKQTGQLPDWFLGLEALDTSDAPDWFAAEEKEKPKATSEEIPPWMSDMVEEETPEPEAEPSDEIGSFFSSLTGSAAEAEAEESPEVDWFHQPEPDDEIDNSADAPADYPADVPDVDFFARLVGGSIPAQETQPAPPVQPKARPQIELPDIDDFVEEAAAPAPEPAPKAVDIPQNELDAFFDNLAAGRTTPATPSASLDDIEDPDLDWVVEPVAEEPIPDPEPEAFAPPAEDTTNWLNELNNIVSSATRPLQPQPEETVSFGTKDNWDEPAPVEDSADEEIFTWPTTSYQDAPVAEEAQESDWLSGITADDAVADEQEVAPSEPAPPSQESSLLAGRLRRTEEAPLVPAEPETTPEDQPDQFAPPAPVDSTDESLFPEEELQSGWMSDDLFAEAATPDAGDADFFSMLQSNADANVLANDPGKDQPQGHWDDHEDVLSEADFLSALSLDHPAASEDDFLTSLGLSDVEAQPAEAEDNLPVSPYSPTESAAPDEDDFFARLSTDSEDEDQQPAAVEEDALAQWSSQQQFAASGEDEDQLQPVEEDALAQWSHQQQSAAEPEEEDFFARLTMDDQSDGGEQTGVEEDALGLWSHQQSAAEPQEEDFFASLGIDSEDQQQPTASEEDQFGQRGAQPQTEAAASQEEDFFASLGIDSEDQQQPTASEEDQFGQWGALPQNEAATQEDDFFASLGIDNEDDNNLLPAASEEDQYGQWGTQQPNDELPQSGDLFSALDDQQPEDEAESQTPDLFGAYAGGEAAPAPIQDDPFAWDTQAEMPPTEDFFTALGMIDDQQTADQKAVWDRQEAPPEADFFTALGMIGDATTPPTEPAPERAINAPAYGDVDSYLASLSDEQPEIEPNELFSQSGNNIDIDDLFSQAVMSDAPKPAAPSGDALPGANEDWLAQLQPSVGEVSASAMVRQKEDRPVEELPDRLKKLRQRAEQIPDETPALESGAPNAALPGVSTAPFIGADAELVNGVALTPEQQNKVNLLKELVPSANTSQSFRLSAIEATYDSPFMPDLEDNAETVVVPPKADEPKARRKKVRSRPPRRIHIDRFFVAVVLAAAVILPFLIPGLRIGSLPPPSFPAGSGAQIAFNQISALHPGDLVLVGVEYGPTAAAELDGMTDAILRHIIMQAAYPVIVSSNPLGALRADDMLAAISNDAAFLARIGAHQPLQTNQDYYVVRYLPGSVIGLRAFSADTANGLLSDIRGQATHLVVRSLQDFALITLITDRAEDMRAYAEQIAPLTRSPMVAAVSYSADPLAEPYAHVFGGGLLVGYRDAYTYHDLLSTINAQSIAQRIRIIPTDVPTPTPTQVAAPPIASTAEATTEATAEAAVTPEATPAPRTATVISRQSVNMRSGPSTGNSIVTVVPSGTTATIIAVSADGAWVNVRLASGQEGWISAALMSISPAASPKLVARFHPKGHLVPAEQAPDPGEGSTPTPRPTHVLPTSTPETPSTPLAPAATLSVSAGSTGEVIATTAPTATHVPTSTPRPTLTATPTQTPTVEATSAVTAEARAAGITFTLPPPSPGYRDERWYAMNLGIIASVFIISFGALFNVVRGLLRRGRRA